MSACVHYGSKCDWGPCMRGNAVMGCTPLLH